MKRREFLSTAALATAGVMLAKLTGAQEAGTAFSFAVIADPHLREDREGEATGVDKFRKALAALAAVPETLDFLLLLGDIHPEKLAPLMPEIPLPLHVVHGNHETAAHRQQLREMFPQDFGGQDFYGFTHKACRFTGLCTALVGDHVGHFESQDITPKVGQVAWLENELRQHAQMPRFIYAHIPPEPQNRPGSSSLGSLESKWFHELVERERPSACFFGHRHIRLEYRCGTTPIYYVPSCNWNSPGNPSGFYVVTVGGEGSAIRFVAI